MEGELVDKELQLFEAKAALAPLERTLEYVKQQHAETQKELAARDTTVAILRGELELLRARPHV